MIIKNKITFHNLDTLFQSKHESMHLKTNHINKKNYK